MKPDSRFCTLLILVGGCLLATGVRSEDPVHWIESDRAKLSLGTFIIDYESEFRLTSDRLGLGTKLSFEDDLGLDDSDTVIRLDGHYRFSARHRAEFSYFDLSREGTTVTSRPIVVDDTLFRRGSELDTTFDYQILKLSYAYSFWQTGKVDLAASGGLYTFDLGISIDSDEGKSEGDEGTAPFPVVGLHLDYRIDDMVYVATSFEYFVINESDFDGEITDAIIGLEIRYFKNIGFGLGYNAVDISIDSDDGEDTFDYSYSGALLYASWHF